MRHAWTVVCGLSLTHLHNVFLAGTVFGLLCFNGMVGPSRADEPPPYAIALEAYDAGRYEEAAAIWANLSDQGANDARLALAALYDQGLGVGQDGERAMRLYRLAADEGHRDAQRILGTRYADGVGVAKDNDAARYWLGLAAAAGSNWASDRLTLVGD